MHNQTDFSELETGPALIAIWSNAQADSQFQLGTLEYQSHSHLRGQIFCIESGLVQVRTKQGSWLMPPHRAGWIPPGHAHSVSVTGVMSGWTVLVTPLASAGFPANPCVIGVNDLMLALVRRAASWNNQIILDPEQDRLIDVLIDEIQRAPQQNLHLPMPIDRRVLRVATEILSNPSDQRSLEQWAVWGNMSARTLSRLMRAETSLSFSQWRQQARLFSALELLASREKIADIAEALGYATPSNFIAMFRKNFGVSPGHYFSQIS